MAVRGRLRVLLGAAPGVGKTYMMLEEGHRLHDLGKDVVVAVVETHEREATAALLNGLELIPRRTVEHRGITLTEMDLDAVIARKPALALVDELAHTNAPGSANAKRWQDVEQILAAGIDVISTVNVQHIESLNDVVEQITGVPQRETIPDSIVRSADQIEVVDLTPQSLRDRLAEGQVYPAARIDAALSNYFRLGNLTALRELTLVWLADEVDQALQRYRAEHGIQEKWEARERVVVALTGGPEGETLLRRGARVAARSGSGELLAVHVASQDGLRETDPAALAAQRKLVEELGGTYHQVVGTDTPEALVAFAKASNATQLVIGVSRRNRLTAFLTGSGVGATVIRESGDIDVHIVSHAAAAGGRNLPKFRRTGALSIRRRVYGFALALIAGPLLTLALLPIRSPDSLTAETLSYQLLVVVVALVGGIWPALFAAVLSGLTLDFVFVSPYNTLTIGLPTHLLALALYIVIAALVSVVVDQSARRTRSAARASAESELLVTIAGSVIRGGDAVQSLVSRTREAFGLKAVRFIADDGAVMTVDGDIPADAVPTRVPVGERGSLELFGDDLQAGDRRLLSVIVTQLDAALEHADLSNAAQEIGPLEATDRVRTALLAAVGHDLRRPLAAATAAVTSLRTAGSRLSSRDKVELLDTAEVSLRNLADLLTNLLDVSRVQAGVLAVSLQPVDLEDLLPPVLDELSIRPGEVTIDVPEDLPPVTADPVLLRRAIVNLLSNALRYSPVGQPPRLSASTFGGQVEVRVADHGPGVPDDRKEEIFHPFQRMGDTDNNAGIGLGLALTKGFVEGMGGTLVADDTPAGGLTMVLALPVDQESVARRAQSRADAGLADDGPADDDADDDGRADGGPASEPVKGA
ncbi:ATP-binding protein [Leifsonia shinshuensis]|uniref:histidine kinase n=1 Tax=Leifsonia shinshuensis TaxID=150026 RepID=A0A853CSD7_9MICO|nr:ATP-binding protein [Leifsonia shinshuensis]NYJ23302.1 two-component system sensor histidine kinase KdpD [Leifsonia shinshuensis]